jgi:hypothetical protein
VPQPFLEAPHLSPILLVIVAQKMQKAMEGEQANFRRSRVPVFGGLTARHAARDAQITEKNRLG